ncbi:MAG: hypothetical protein GF350_06995 [Chitinivibrionales bacterium]|nr:hypothetical protein [Chitinivibrionales bacterium]
MEKTYPFDRKTIDKLVTKNCPGVYIILKNGRAGWRVSFIRRAEKNVRRAIIAKCEKCKNRSTMRFMFSYAANAKSAFDLECIFYYHVTCKLSYNGGIFYFHNNL